MEITEEKNAVNYHQVVEEEKPTKPVVTKESVKEAQKQAKQKFDEWFHSEDTQSRLRQVAEYLHSVFGSQWFTLDKMQKRTGYKKPEEAIQTLSFLNTGGWIESRMSENVKNPREKYRVILTEEDRLSLLEQEQSTLELQLKQLKARIKEQKQKLSKKKEVSDEVVK